MVLEKPAISKVDFKQSDKSVNQIWAALRVGLEHDSEHKRFIGDKTVQGWFKESIQKFIDASVVKSVDYLETFKKDPIIFDRMVDFVSRDIETNYHEELKKLEISIRWASVKMSQADEELYSKITVNAKAISIESQKISNTWEERIGAAMQLCLADETQINSAAKMQMIVTLALNQIKIKPNKPNHDGNRDKWLLIFIDDLKLICNEIHLNQFSIAGTRSGFQWYYFDSVIFSGRQVTDFAKKLAGFIADQIPKLKS